MSHASPNHPACPSLLQPSPPSSHQASDQPGWAALARTAINRLRRHAHSETDQEVADAAEAAAEAALRAVQRRGDDPPADAIEVLEALHRGAPLPPDSCCSSITGFCRTRHKA